MKPSADLAGFPTIQTFHPTYFHAGPVPGGNERGSVQPKQPQIAETLCGAPAVVQNSWLRIPKNGTEPNAGSLFRAYGSTRRRWYLPPEGESKPV